MILTLNGKSSALSVVSRFPNSDDSSSGQSSHESYLGPLLASFSTYMPSMVWETTTASSQSPTTTAHQHNNTHLEIAQSYKQLNNANQRIPQTIHHYQAWILCLCAT
jgi:hypothetical protein